MNNLIECLQHRLAIYEKAIAMSTGFIPWDNNFDWPSGTGDDPHKYSIYQNAI